MNALIVSNTEKSIAFFTELLNAAFVGRITVVGSCAEARQLLFSQDFDLVIINAPLKDETGEALSRHIAGKGLGQAILVVKAEFFDAVTAATEAEGVLTVSKPVNKATFWSALKLASAVQNRVKRLQAENNRLTQKIEDIRMIDRAKYVLMSSLRLSEQEAHRYIEKQAMDLRITKRAVAESLLKTYEEG